MILRSLCACALAVWPAHVWAQEERPHPWAKLFEHPDTVASPTGSERRNLPGGVVVTRRPNDGGWQYAGLDTSGYGAMVCLLEIYQDLDAMIHACPDMASEPQKNRLDEVLAGAATFFAAKDVPPMAESAFWESIAQHRLADAPEMCPSDADAVADVEGKIDEWLSEEIVANMAVSLSVPRLPVANPCF